MPQIFMNIAGEGEGEGGEEKEWHFISVLPVEVCALTTTSYLWPFDRGWPLPSVN